VGRVPGQCVWGGEFERMASGRKFAEFCAGGIAGKGETRLGGSGCWGRSVGASEGR